MKLRWLLAALGLALMPLGAHAQIGLYFNPIATRVSNSQADTGPFAFLGAGNTSETFGGLSMGGYYDLSHAPKVALGVDVRDELEHGNSALLNSFLFGIRAEGKAPKAVFKPYVQLSGGVGSTHSPLNPARSNKFMYKIYGGLDYGLGKHVDWRVVEIGYGSITTVNSTQFGTTSTYPASQVLSFSAGLVFRIR